ncbi:MAG: DNA-3-methyladenine glycosylase 2 family protein [Gemmatimonadaceae bacterium]|nr:DNA-3-methyladenine glycosylase 2 family protein [Gemmatimonadaceae bacterium]
MHRQALRHLRSADPVLARIIDRVGPCRLRADTSGSHFDAVIRSIVYQQLSGSAAFTIFTRFRDLYGGRTPTPEELLATPDETLRGVGLSRQKIAYMRDLADRVVRADVPIHALHELDDEAVVAALTRVKGVGEWTAQMFLLFRLGRPNVLPVLDLGVRKAIQRAYGMRKLPSLERVRKIGAAWSPYCSVAVWYLWRSLEVDGLSGTPPEKRQSGGAAAKRGTKRPARSRAAAASRSTRARGTAAKSRSARGRRRAR